ncbi:hypothetical protein LIER_09378 [Lithospermum erythrorhizon]|uniref:Uncharacterized protein n=1 Tax=Lithospermum erythrorhizon TaxID=34254 RepID=A0AAV3PH30_LITER
MANKLNFGESKTRNCALIFITVGLCCFFYSLVTWQNTAIGRGDIIAVELTNSIEACDIVSNLNIDTYHGRRDLGDGFVYQFEDFKPCAARKMHQEGETNGLIDKVETSMA